MRYPRQLHPMLGDGYDAVVIWNGGHATSGLAAGRQVATKCSPNADEPTSIRDEPGRVVADPILEHYLHIPNVLNVLNRIAI